MWIPALGFRPEMVIICLGIEALWQFQLHSVYIPKMGFIEKLFNTHTMHQVHHARNIEYMDKNHGGFLNIFDKAENAFISAYRKYNKDESFDIKVEYISAPELDGKILILADPMLATGSSMVLAYESLLHYGKPKHVHFASIISSAESIEFLKKKVIGSDYTIWTAAVDEELTAQSYIVPGLGDAGDLAYGKKT